MDLDLFFVALKVGTTRTVYRFFYTGALLISLGHDMVFCISFYIISQCERTTAPSVWNLLLTEEWVRPYGWPHVVSWGWTNRVAIWEQTCVVPGNVLLDRGSISPHGKGQFYGDKIWMQRLMQLQRSVCESYASLCQITLNTCWSSLCLHPSIVFKLSPSAYHRRIACEGHRVVALPCPWSTARLQRSPVRRAESFQGWTSYLFCGRPCRWATPRVVWRSVEWYVDVELKSHVCRCVVIKPSHKPKYRNALTG